MPISLRDAGFWLSVVACVVAQGAIVRSVFASRSVHASESVPRPRLAVELSWAVMPAVALVVLFWLTWGALHAS